MIDCRTLGFCLILACAGALNAARANDNLPMVVGRVAAVAGTISTSFHGGPWTDSGVNDPLVAGNAVRTDPANRAVVQIGDETIAIAEGSELDLGRLDDGVTQIGLRQGRVDVKISRSEPGHNVEVDVPHGGVWLLGAGDYDITAGDEHTAAKIAVARGHARVVGNGMDETLDAGSATTMAAGDPVVSANNPASGTEGADSFTTWRKSVEGDDSGAAALGDIPPGVTGYQSLAADGDWETVGDDGIAWFPKALPAGWAPFRYGHWRWMQAWGWTWVDDMEWGFAPSHYGRWARFAASDGGTERWGWVAGKSSVPAAFTPAAVAFLGTAGVGLSYPDASGPAVGWFPLAPDEVYWPRYTSDIALIRQINTGIVADAGSIEPGADGMPPSAVVDAEYANRRFASVVPRPVFVGGGEVSSAIVQLPQQRLENAPLLAGSPQIAPPAPRPAANVTVAARPAVMPPAERVKLLARVLAPGHGPVTLAARERGGRWHALAPRRWQTRVVAAAWRASQVRLRLATHHR
jgi:hypothetical protein